MATEVDFNELMDSPTSMGSTRSTPHPSLCHNLQSHLVLHWRGCVGRHSETFHVRSLQLVLLKWMRHLPRVGKEHLVHLKLMYYKFILGGPTRCIQGLILCFSQLYSTPLASSFHIVRPRHATLPNVVQHAKGAKKCFCVGFSSQLLEFSTCGTNCGSTTSLTMFYVKNGSNLDEKIQSTT